MNLMGLFRSPQNELEKGGKEAEDAGIRSACPRCGVQDLYFQQAFSAN